MEFLQSDKNYTGIFSGWAGGRKHKHTALKTADESRMKESVVESFDLFAGLGAGQNIFAGLGAGQNIFAGLGAGQNILVLRQRYLLSSLEDIFSGISKIFQRKLNLALKCDYV